MISAVFSCHSDRPGRVRIASTETTCHSVTIHWISPLDENNFRYEVKIRSFFQMQNQTRPDSVLAPSTLTSWTIDNIPSEVPVTISLAAINKRSKAGPSVHTTIITKKPC